MAIDSNFLKRHVQIVSSEIKTRFFVLSIHAHGCICPNIEAYFDAFQIVIIYEVVRPDKDAKGRKTSDRRTSLE